MCTTFSLYLMGSNSPDVITARTMDFARDLKTQVKVIPQADANNTQLGDYTLWGVIRDHKNLVYYFYTSFNNNLSAIDLKKLDLTQGKLTLKPLIQPTWSIDLTEELVA